MGHLLLSYDNWTNKHGTKNFKKKEPRISLINRTNPSPTIVWQHTRILTNNATNYLLKRMSSRRSRRIFLFAVRWQLFVKQNKSLITILLLLLSLVLFIHWSAKHGWWNWNWKRKGECGCVGVMANWKRKEADICLTRSLSQQIRHKYGLSIFHDSTSCFRPYFHPAFKIYTGDYKTGQTGNSCLFQFSSIFG